MTSIDSFKITNNGAELSIVLSTDLGFMFSSLEIWLMDDYKNENLVKDFTGKLHGTNNVTLTISNVEAGVSKFEDLIFMKVRVNRDEPSVTAVTYEVSSYYNCLMSQLLKLAIDPCVNCNRDKDKQMVITISLLLDMVVKTLSVGYVQQAINMIHKLKSLCKLSTCKNCPTVTCTTCNNFIQIP